MGWEAFCYGLVILAPISLALTLVAQFTAFLVLAPGRKVRKDDAPPVTILKPVKGDEDGLYENLASLARQDYPDYEIRIGAEDAVDPALEVARRVQADHPQVRIHVQAGSRRLGLNPKVNLLAALAEDAEHDVLLISDSNVRVGADYLRETAAELSDPDVALVSNVLVGQEADRLGGVLESLHVNSFVASAASFTRVVGGRTCVIGKSMLFRRRDLDAVGGFESVSDVLAEDYVIGRSFELAGRKVALSPHLVPTVNRGWTLERFVNRHVRWAQMRRRLSLPAYLGELFLNPIAWIASALIGLSFSQGRPDVRLAIAALCGVVLKCVGDALLWRRLTGKLPPPGHVPLMPVKDILMAGIWVVGAFRKTVNWRGNLFSIERGSRLVPQEHGTLTSALEEVI
jgi:ceramide glucosyltransferase